MIIFSYSLQYRKWQGCSSVGQLIDGRPQLDNKCQYRKASRRCKPATFQQDLSRELMLSWTHRMCHWCVCVCESLPLHDKDTRPDHCMQDNLIDDNYCRKCLTNDLPLTMFSHSRDLFFCPNAQSMLCEIRFTMQWMNKSGRSLIL